ncbi:MAG: hypothetical protein JNM27_10980 [Leptospirales bacterium]|nr:hypothetical protein [Leptospirales bacterium]
MAAGFKDLTTEEIRYYHSLLTEELTDFDCGDLCKGDNGGEPYCCKAEHAVPLLYKAEFEHLKAMGDLWHEWKPVTGEDKKIKETASRDQLFCECKGIAHCVRDQRSISCRTFPLEPYLDRRNVIIGLTFVRDFTQRDPDTGKVKCPMTRRKNDVRQEFVDAHFVFWEKIMLRREEEFETYVETSRSLRRERNRTGRQFQVLMPSHLKESRMARKFMY